MVLYYYNDLKKVSKAFGNKEFHSIMRPRSSDKQIKTCTKNELIFRYFSVCDYILNKQPRQNCNTYNAPIKINNLHKKCSKYQS